MGETSRSKRPFLAANAPRDRVLQAMFANMRAWIIRYTHANGGEIHQRNGATWVYTPDEGGDALIAFPDLDPAHASEQLDEMIAYYRKRQPLKDVIFWSTEPPRPTGIEAQLIARGFEWSSQPHWMWLDMRNLRLPPTIPKGLRIEVMENAPLWNVTDLPYYNRSVVQRRRARKSARIPYVWHIAASLDGQLVGHAILHLTTGELGVAGIFDVGVVPEARNKGVGKAITFSTCSLAQKMGCRHVVLNSTPAGEPVYKRLGFGSLGNGHVWLLRAKTLAIPPAAPWLIACAEAVGRGDVNALEQLAQSQPQATFDGSLPSGVSLLQIAVNLRQRAAAEWLIAHGANLDVVSAWDLGWHERARELLTVAPEQANKRLGNTQLTPLHIATERGDAALAHLLLAAYPDLTLSDSQFHSTALGWAYQYQRSEIIAMIEQHTRKRR
jgi:predicted N-acetyltransferase YhbS